MLHGCLSCHTQSIVDSNRRRIATPRHEALLLIAERLCDKPRCKRFAQTSVVTGTNRIAVPNAPRRGHSLAAPLGERFVHQVTSFLAKARRDLNGLVHH